jgi:hypothetical protein
MDCEFWRSSGAIIVSRVYSATLQFATIYHWNPGVYRIYLTVCQLPVHTSEYAANWRLVGDPVLNATPKARLSINCWLPEGASGMASCHDKKHLDLFVPFASVSVKRN